MATRSKTQTQIDAINNSALIWRLRFGEKKTWWAVNKEQRMRCKTNLNEWMKIAMNIFSSRDIFCRIAFCNRWIHRIKSQSIHHSIQFTFTRFAYSHSVVVVRSFFHSFSQCYKSRLKSNVIDVRARKVHTCSRCSNVQVVFIVASDFIATVQFRAIYALCKAVDDIYVCVIAMHLPFCFSLFSRAISYFFHVRARQPAQPVFDA